MLKNYRKIVLRMLPIIILLLSFGGNVLAQTQRINGTIYDENCKPLEGVSIYQIKTANGTITNENGNFELELVKKRKISILISFIGYKSVLIENADTISTKLIIKLKEDPVELCINLGFKLSNMDWRNISNQSVIPAYISDNSMIYNNSLKPTVYACPGLCGEEANPRATLRRLNSTVLFSK